MPAAKQTTDHQFIRRWTEERNGIPSTVKSTKKQGETGVLRIDFKGEDESDDRNLTRIEWDEFFQKFEEAGLAFLYQETTSEGAPSRFFKLVKRESARRPAGTAPRQAATAKRATATRQKGAAPRKEAAKAGTSPRKTEGPSRGSKSASSGKRTSGSKSSSGSSR